MSHSCKPIGIFDSGAGGLSVLSELLRLMPKEHYIYFADTANCPYGPKPHSDIIKLVDAITKFLLQKNCKLIVVACNTATAAAIDYLRANYPIPFVGMEPAIKPASQNTKTKSIGVLATAGTFKGRLYIETSRKYASDVNVCYQVGEGLVELVETGKANSPEAEELLHRYVDPMIDCNIDHLVLGCTHYPFLKPVLNKILPANVKVIDPSPAVVLQTQRILHTNNLECVKEGNDTFTEVDFYSSGQINVLRQLLENNIEVDLPINVSYTDNVVLRHNL